jgi:hypothetical protein
VRQPNCQHPLTYVDATPARAKSTSSSDIVGARYVDIVDGVRVVQAVDFVSDDPALPEP